VASLIQKLSGTLERFDFFLLHFSGQVHPLPFVAIIEKFRGKQDSVFEKDLDRINRNTTAEGKTGANPRR